MDGARQRINRGPTIQEQALDVVLGQQRGCGDAGGSGTDHDNWNVFNDSHIDGFRRGIAEKCGIPDSASRPLRWVLLPLGTMPRNGVAMLMRNAPAYADGPDRWLRHR